MNFIFLYDMNNRKIIHYNNGITNLLGTKFHENDAISELIKDGMNSLYNTDMGRTFFHYQEEQYIFDIDKIDHDILIFNGRKKEINDSILNNDIDAHKLLRMLSDNLPDMLWAKDVNGKYIFANKAICENLLMAKDTNEPIGKGDVLFALREREKHKENKDWHTFGELCFNSDEVVLENMKNMVFEEYGNVKGKPLYLEVHKAPFFDTSGRLLGTVGSGRDITEEIKTKRELQLKEELINQQSKMAIMGEMLENIIHQWKQPLSVISVMTTTAQLHNEIGIPIDNQEYFEKITTHIMHLSQTIEDFRDFFKEDKTKTKYIVSNIYEKTIDLLMGRIKKQSIDLISNCEQFEIIGYPRELMQVLMNVYANACDEFEKVDTSFDLKLIITNIVKKDNQAIITIKDNAGGIPESIIDKIFESKFTTKSESKGSGIGLFMSKEIITKHMNGTISVSNTSYLYENKSYNGASFTIELPILEN